MNKVAGQPQPLFLQRIHGRKNYEAAEKKDAETTETTEKRKAEERKRLTILALDLALVALKANQRRPACRHRSRPKPRKDIWSHIGDFVFGD